MRWRVLYFLAGVLALFAGMALENRLALLIVPAWALGFALLVQRHRRVQAAVRQFQGWQRIKRTHLARMQLDWEQLPAESVAAPRDHPFAVDLDMTGEYALHRLLDTAVSQNGSERLKDWLLARVPDLETIDQRQKLVRELLPLTMFRDRLTLSALLAAGQFQPKWNGDALLKWLRLNDEGGQVSGAAALLLLALAGLNIVLLLLFSVGLLPPLWSISLGVFLALSAWHWRGLGDLFGEALRIDSQLRRLRAVFRQMETYSYGERSHLRVLCAPFLEPAQRPSAHLRRIGWIMAAASLRGNPIVWLVLNLLLPWDIGAAYLLARSKGDLARALPRWLDVWYELEALSSLATFAFLNPQYTFPQIEARHAPGSVFLGRQLGHPLIPADVKVCNDFEIRQLGQLYIITGSNMAGKSSFLRTLGVNLALAYAGSVVNAGYLRVGLFRLFTCIRVSDSVVDGFSYFYAEVRRLKALLDALDTEDALPLFYLIDEIFRGTNNRERLIGSRSYIRALAGKPGVGLIATHDLELTRLAEAIPQLENYHFRETVIEGRMLFDYRLHPGPSPTTNALKIMRLQGLPVEAEGK